MFVQDIASISQRDVKTMLSITTSSEEELLSVFFDKVFILSLMKTVKTYFNVDFSAPIQAQSVMPQASCVSAKGGDPRLVVFVSLANQSEPIVQGYGVT